jgi:hypothetical protein
VRETKAAAHRRSGSGAIQHPQPQQIKVGVPVHAPLDHLEPQDLAMTLWLGAGLASGNLVIVAALGAILLPAYSYRIQVEEVTLRQHFGKAFDQYTKHHKKVIPFLY